VEALWALAGQAELQELAGLLLLDHEQVPVAEQQQPLAEGVLVGRPGPLLARVVLDGQVQDVEQALQRRVEHEHRPRDLAKHEHPPGLVAVDPLPLGAPPDLDTGRGEQRRQVMAGEAARHRRRQVADQQLVAVVADGQELPGPPPTGGPLADPRHFGQLEVECLPDRQLGRHGTSPVPGQGCPAGRVPNRFVPLVRPEE